MMDTSFGDGLRGKIEEELRKQKEERAKTNGHAADGEFAKPAFVMLDELALDTDVFWAIEDILPRGTMVMVYGRGGCGKTYLLASTAIGIASGRWFGHDAEKGAVLYCAFERPEDAEDRFAALRDRFKHNRGPSKSPDAGIGALQKLFLKELRRQAKRHPQGVDEQNLRSGFILALNQMRAAKGDQPLTPQQNATKFSNTARGILERTPPLASKHDGLWLANDAA